MEPHTTTLLIFFNNKKSNEMENLIINQPRTAKLVLIDDVTGAEIPTSWEGVSAVSESNSIVTAEPQPDPNFALLTPQGAGTANINFATTAAYNNSNGILVREAKTYTMPVQVQAQQNSTSFKVVLV